MRTKMIKVSEPVYELLREMKDRSQSFNDVIVELIDYAQPSLRDTSIWSQQKAITGGEIRRILEEHDRKQEERFSRLLDESISRVVKELDKRQEERLESALPSRERKQKKLKTEGTS
jgi:predicted CopG family antitoxin